MAAQLSFMGVRGDRRNDDDFEKFWAACPRKIGKFDARKKYDAARKVATATDILTGMHRYADSVKGKDKQYICHPATWLCQGRWLDEDASAVSAAPDEKINGQPMHIWILWMQGWRNGKKFWPTNIVGPKPGEKGCRVPDALLNENEIAAK